MFKRPVQATTMMELGDENFKNMKYNQNLQQHLGELKCDAPPSSLMDSTVSPKMKIVEGERVGRAPWLVALRG
jgi:hypothetical protein